MKNYSAILLLMIPVLILWGGCSKKKKTVAPYGWETTTREFDSLTCMAESLYHARDAQGATQAVAHMRLLAEATPEKSVQRVRTLYWEGRIAFTRGEIDQAMTMMEEALEMTDSARYPYDWHRIKWNLDLESHPPTLERYQYLLSELDFFLSTGDKPIAGAYAQEVGGFLHSIGDAEYSVSYLRMSDSLFQEAGMQDEVAANRINFSNALQLRGDTLAAVAILKKMLEDTSSVARHSRDIVLGNLYVLAHDTTYLHQAYNMISRNPLMNEEAFAYENMLTGEALCDGDVELARMYSDRARARLPEVYLPENIRDYYNHRSRVCALEGESDSAYEYLYRASLMTDSINSSTKKLEIRDANVARKIAEARLKADIERRKSIIVQLTICFTFLIILGFGAWLVHRRWQQQKLQRVHDDLRMERANRRVMAMELLVKEKETLFQNMGAEMAELSQAGEISRTAANKLGSTLKAHSGTKAERDTFLESFGELGPDFGRALRKAYPALTDADVRMAGFVALGLDNKHIARVAGIRPESVKQARWRLRGKLGLQPGSSLEDAVRKFIFNKV